MRIKERNDAVTQDKGLIIQIDPGVAQAFHASTAVSRKYTNDSVNGIQAGLPVQYNIQSVLYDSFVIVSIAAPVFVVRFVLC